LLAIGLSLFSPSSPIRLAVLRFSQSK
jgi:hypothetical protein